MKTTTRTPKKQQRQRLECSSCGKVVPSPRDARKHPVLETLQCLPCNTAYQSVGDLSKYRRGVELNGSDNYCRWCLDGGDLIMCTDDTCRSQFCDTCIKRNLGPTGLKRIQDNRAWYCFVCDLKQLDSLQVNWVNFRTLVPITIPKINLPIVLKILNSNNKAPTTPTSKSPQMPVSEKRPVSTPTPKPPQMPVSETRPVSTPASKPPQMPISETRPVSTPASKPLQMPVSEKQPVSTPTLKSPQMPLPEKRPVTTPTSKSPQMPVPEKRPVTTPTSKSPHMPVSETRPISTPTSKPPQMPVPEKRPVSTPILKPAQPPSQPDKVSRKINGGIIFNLGLFSTSTLFTLPAKTSHAPSPTLDPTPESTLEPTSEPKPKPTSEPTPKPTPEPTSEPTPKPTLEPTPKPTPEPTSEPTPKPTSNHTPCLELEELPSNGIGPDALKTLSEELALSDDDDSCNEDVLYSTPITSPEIIATRPAKRKRSDDISDDVKVWAIRDASLLHKRLGILIESLSSVNDDFDEDKFHEDTSHLTNWLSNLEAYLSSVPHIKDRCRNISNIVSELNKQS